MITEHDYDWSQTERELVMVLPSRGRGSQLTPGIIRHFHDTRASLEKWHIVVMNNGVHEDLSHLAQYNCSYFTLTRSLGQGYRNGGHARNYMLKRCRSSRIVMRDAEMFVTGDIISYGLAVPDGESACLWVPYHVFYNAIIGKLSVTVDASISETIKNNPRLDLLSILRQHGLMPYPGHVGCYGVMVPTRVIHEMRGYDEDMDEWGGEDLDLWHRLHALGHTPLPMPPSAQVYGVHLYHESAPYPSKHSDTIYKRKSLTEPRNPNGWGEWPDLQE